MEKEESIIICMPADTPDQLPGSIYGNKCKDCGKELVVAQSTLNLIKERGITDPVYLCLNCLIARDPQDVKVATPSQEQIEEIVKHINKPDSDKTFG